MKNKEQRMQKLELEMDKVLSTKKSKSLVVISFGDTELAYEGTLREFADFIEKAGFEKLRKIKKTGDNWYNFKGENKNLKESYNVKLQYLAEEAELAYDMNIKSYDIYVEGDALKFARLQSEYKTYGDPGKEEK